MRELTNLIATIGENMMVRRMARHAVSQGVVASYVHNAIAPDLGRIAVLVAIESAGDPDVLKDMGRKIAMHVAATQPLSLSVEDLNQEHVEREKAILTEQAKESGKPMQVIEKMIEGRIRKFYEEVVLHKQAFVMNPDQTIEQLVAETAKTLGAPVTITGFTRLALGEGVEKKTEDFAAEVASMTGAALRPFREAKNRGAGRNVRALLTVQAKHSALNARPVLKPPVDSPSRFP